MTSLSSESMDRILDRFDDAWNGPTPPRIEDYLRAGELGERRTLLVELVRIDMERRINAGEAVRLEETYLRPFSALNDNREALLSLAAREFELRRRREPNLSLNEYLERWPQLREELTRLFGVQPTLSTANDGTHNGQPPADEETGAIFKLLASPQTPDELGRLATYRLVKLLGSGGMGVVFLAEDTALKRLVALKVMRPGLAANVQARQRFVREAQAMAALKHEGIVTIYQVGEDRGLPFLAMEYLQGETLHERLRRDKMLPLAEALRIGGALADGLSAAHARGLVHRDIKPANIWLESEPRPSEPRPLGSGADNRSLTVAAPKDAAPSRVKLLDFGLARSSGGDDGHLTQTGVILGTPAFLSPEQARGEKVDARSDLFSLGCVLYRTLTGQLPFQGRDVMSSLLSLAHDHPKPPRELNPQIPLPLNHLIQRLLAKSAADRPSSAETVAKTLRTLKLEDATIPLPPPAPQPPPSPAPTPPRRRRMSKALVALALCGLIVLLGAIIIRIRSKDGRETTIEVPEGSAVTIEEKGKALPALGFALAFAEDKPQAHKTPPKSFTALFNGTDLSGWHGMTHFDPYELAEMSEEQRKAKIADWNDDLKKHWKVENGEIVNDGDGVYLTSDKEFGDIELLVDYKMYPKGDSGIYLKATPQVQIWDYTKEGGKWDLGADKGSGGLWNNSKGAAGKDPLVLADKPFGEWNHFRILMFGDRVTVYLNDKLVVKHARLENFWKHGLPLPPKGPIQLQTHGSEIRWRNILVREIPADEANKWLRDMSDAKGFQDVFNGKNFEGWVGPLENHEVKDGSIVCKQGNGGTIYTKEEYGDFVVRLEFKLPKNGNNGLAIRYPGKGDTAYDGMCELQVLDDAYKEIDPRQAHGSAYGMVAAQRGYQRPIGQWNYQEVTVKGSTIKIELNGSVILDCDLSKVTNYMADSKHPGKERTRGHFGFAGYNDPVEFRKIQIKRLDEK